MIAIINAKIFQKTSSNFETRNILLDQKGIIIGLGYIPDSDKATVIDAKGYIVLPSISDPFFNNSPQSEAINPYLKAGITHFGFKEHPKKATVKTVPYTLLLSDQKDDIIKAILHQELDFFTIPRDQATYYLPVLLSVLKPLLSSKDLYKILVQAPLFFESEKFGLTKIANFTVIHPDTGHLLAVFYQGKCQAL